MTGRANLEELTIAAREKAKEGAYWREKLSGELIKSVFPYDYIDPDEIGAEVGVNRVEQTISSQLAALLLKVGNNNDYMLHIVLLAGLTLLLGKYSGNEDIIIGTPIYKQETEGEFLNTILALRMHLDGEKSFKQLLMQMKNTLSEATDNQNYPLEALQYQLDMPISQKEFFLFDVALLLENIHSYDYIRHIDVNMVFSFSREGDTIKAAVSYNPLRYRESTAQQNLTHLILILEQAFKSSNTPIASLDFLDEQEKKMLLDDFNRSELEYPKDMLLHQMFEEQVRETPGNTALVFGDRSMTYLELNHAANQLARLLRQKGVGTETIVGLSADISMETIVGMIAILKAGGAFLPVAPDIPVERIEYIIRDSDISLFLTSCPMPGEINNLTEIIDTTDPSLYRGDTADLNPVNSPGDTVYIIYTSGSTGGPKGSLLEHRNIVNQIYGLKKLYYSCEPLRHILLAPFTFDPSVQHVFSPLTYGAVLYLVSNEIKIDAGRLMETIVEHKIDVFDGVPSQLNVLVEFAEEFEKISFKYIILAGEVFPLSLLNKLRSVFETEQIINIYGPTEATINSTHYICPQEVKHFNIPIGKPLMNYKIRILDNHLRLVPVGVIGEIHIAGDGIARGYFNRPELTGERFIENPYVPGERLYKTGDLGKWLPDGNLEFSGRVDLQVKIRGHRIELEEIERQILKHPDVREAIVIDRESSSGDKFLCAYLISDTQPRIPELREMIGKYLPDYMLPSYFVQLDQIPMTPHGKLDREALPAPQDTAGSADYVPPQNEVEEKLVQIWSETLEVPIERIGIDTDFFEIGGHSLNTTSLTSRIHKAFNVKIPLGQIFDKPTIRQISEFIRENTQDIFVPIEKAPEQESYPLSSAQRRLFVLHQIDAGGTSYNMPQVIKLLPPVNKEKIEDSFKKMIRRHESLRTSFKLEKGESVQQIHPEVPFNVTQLPPGDDGLKQAMNDFIKPFDLSRPPLLRAALLNTGDGSTYLLTDMHHIITDGFSQGIIERDFVIFYNGGQMQELRLQYKDFTSWQNSEAVREAMRKQEQYWVNKFSGEIPVLNLPNDFPRPPVQDFSGAEMFFQLERDDVRRLKKLAVEKKVTLFMAVLSMFTVFLSRLSGQEEIIVGTPVLGRRHSDLEHIIGMFVNTLALRCRSENDLTFMDYLNEIRQTTIQAFENQEYPFEGLVDKVAANRDTGRNPLFDVMFSYLTQPTAPKPSGDDDRYGGNTSKFELSLDCVEAEGGLFFRFEFATALFKPETIERFSDYFKRTCAAILEDPGRKISDIRLISEPEKQRVIEAFNVPKIDYDKTETVIGRFEEQVNKTPQRVALIFNDQPVLYRELNQRANRLANLLRDKGVQPGSIVGIMTPPSIEMMVALLAVLKAGGAYLPLDPAHPQDRLRYMLGDSGARFVLTRQELLDTFPADLFDGELIDLDNERSFAIEDSNPASVNRPDHLAYVIYTSGTTGVPKGVMVEHRNLSAYLFAFQREFSITEEDTVLQQASFTFDAFVEEFYPALLNGAKVVVAPRETVQDARLLSSLIVKHSVSLISCSPLVLNELNKTEKMESLRIIISGGDVLKREHVSNLLETGTVYNTYGPTEATVCGTYFKCEGDFKADIPIGKPVTNYNIYICAPHNREHLQPVGVAGELCIAGDGVTRGYLGKPEITREVFVDDPFIPGQRMYRTGDLARWMPDGNIEFLGRIDQQVNIRGFRIETGEIVSALSGHEDIRDVVVIDRGREDGQKYLCAYYTLHEFHAGSPPNSSALREFLASRLPVYMIPAHFIQVEKIPLTPSGKVDRPALPVPSGRVDDIGEYVAPGNDKEEMIADCWKKVLQVDKVGVLDNFFDLGGNSIDIIRVNQELKEAFEVEIPVVAMFRYPSVRALAGYLGKEEKETAVSKENINQLKNKMSKTMNLLRKNKK